MKALICMGFALSLFVLPLHAEDDKGAEVCPELLTTLLAGTTPQTAERILVLGELNANEVLVGMVVAKRMGLSMFDEPERFWNEVFSRASAQSRAEVDRIRNAVDPSLRDL